MPSVRQRSATVDVDCRQLVWRRLKDVQVIVDLHELAPVGGRTAGGRDRRRFERFAQVGEDLPDRPRLRDEGDQPDVAAAGWALERKLLIHPGYQFRPRDPRCVVRPGLCLSVAAASRGSVISRMPTGGGLAPLTNVPVQEKLLYWTVVGWGHQLRGHVVAYGTYPDRGRAHFTRRDARKTLEVDPNCWTVGGLV
jgi:hypothetical protein